MVSVQAVCNSILTRAFQQNIQVSPMKLQKILYFVYREFYQKEEEPLFEEPFQTWKYGPVVRSIYDEFKPFGSNSITCFAKDATNRVKIVDEKNAPAISNSIQTVWECCKDKDGVRLSQLTHTKNSAWWKAFQSGNPTLSNEDISNDKTIID